MNENMIALVAVCAVTVLLAALGVLALAGWLIRVHTKETSRIVFQADERVSASWSLVERALSRITAITFPKGHQLYRSTVGPVIDGAQQRPKQGFIDELDESMAHVAQINGVGVPEALSDEEPP